MNEARVWVLGSSNIDTTFFVDQLPQKGSTNFIRDTKRTFGGKGANLAIVAARSGASVAYIGSVGDDANGHEMHENLSRHGVDTQFLKITPGIPSGAAYITVDSAGNNTILVESGANKRIPLNLSPDFKEGDILISQYEVNFDAIKHYFILANAVGATTILNPSPFAENNDLVQLADYIVVNEVEAELLCDGQLQTDEDTLNCVSKIAKEYGGNVIITLGKNGALALVNNKAHHVPGYAVPAVRDTQGAGDMFLGVFAASLAANMVLQDALLKANLTASMSVESLGSAQVSYPDIQRLNTVFDEQKAKMPLKSKKGDLYEKP